MDINIGGMYFVSDEFFKKTDDPYLKINYEETGRPHYLAMRDSKTDLLWFVPCSSKIEKFEKIVSQKKKLNKPSDAIRIIKVQDKKTVLLFQDMFPITEKYIKDVYIRAGQPYGIIDPKILAELEKTARKIISMLRRGVRFTPTQPDAIKIEQIMILEQE